MDMKRALSGPAFWGTAAAMVLALALGAGSRALFPEGAMAGLAPGYHTALMERALTSDPALLTLPILCALPYTAAFLEEYDSGFYRLYVARCDRRGYVRGKVLAPVLLGGLSLGAGILAAYILSALIYGPLEAAEGQALPPALSLLGLCLRTCLCGGLWAAAGALLGNLCLSRAMAYASPFALFYTLAMLAERYLGGLYVINPRQWVRMETPWPLGGWGVALPVTLLTAILCMVNAAVIEGRLQDG